MNEQLEAVTRMQDYIQAHLNQEITPAGLSKASLFSPWYACRLFKEHVGISPAEYTRRLRLSQSAMQLKHEGHTVTRAAFDSGYGSVDGYIRAFEREFGRSPGEYAKAPVPIQLFIPYGVKFRMKRRIDVDMEKVQTVFVQVLAKPSRKVLIKRGIRAKEYFDYCEEVGCDVWGLLASMDSIGGEPVCLWLPEAYKSPNTSTYVQGVEVGMDYAGPIPEGFDVIVLPQAEYLAAQGEPFNEEDYQEAIVSVQHAINRYDPSLIGYEWDDDNPRIQLEPRGERGYIELRAIKRKVSHP